MKEYIRHLIAMFATFIGSQPLISQDAAAQDRDAQEWAATKAEGTLKAYEDYLARNPIGQYSREAFREIIRLSDGEVNEFELCDDISIADPELTDKDCARLTALY